MNTHVYTISRTISLNRAIVFLGRLSAAGNPGHPQDQMKAGFHPACPAKTSWSRSAQRSHVKPVFHGSHGSHGMPGGFPARDWKDYGPKLKDMEFTYVHLQLAANLPPAVC